ncbi:MAG: YraN family protein [Gammaproteobacteria bacterium]|nr:YraN family protein [Gammaproteobacteria bacterium]MCB1852745.1 YraN family protein [Gammaproteobacteria bacterium]MCP5417965.1 YraN family protein [Chromatiaceae bacterium]
MSNNQARGERGEVLALKYLQHRGLTMVEQNFRSRRGEIDLVMLDVDQLVFVEVRLRNNALFGSAAESITRQKQLRVIQAAHYFLQSRSCWEGHACRFDVVAISEQPQPRIEWIRDAFQPT